MATEQRARALLRALAEEEVPVEAAAVGEQRRRRVVEATALAIAREAQESTRRRRRVWAGVALAAAAALVASAGAVWKGRAAREARIDGSAGSEMPVARGESLVGALHRTHRGETFPEATGPLRLGAGDEVATEPGGRGEVVLVDGVDITLESETRVALPVATTDWAARRHEEVRLATGKVSVHVPPMTPGHTFSIRTPDAEVMVHGTMFVVEVGAPGSPTRPPPTHVSVTSGVVSVTSGGQEAVLTAGMEWASPPVTPKASEPLAAQSPVPRESAPDTPGRASGSSARGPRREAAPGSAVPRSRLGEENQLLATAIAASRSGEYASAVSTLNELLHRFPGSTLAQEAHVERFRALARSGDAASAGREARLYLALYPDGFAREEAKALAVGW